MDMFINLLCFVCLARAQTVLSPPYSCTTTTTICNPGVDTQTGTITPAEERAANFHQGRQGKRGAAGERGDKGEKGDPCQCDLADEEAMRNMRRRMEKLENQILEKTAMILSIQDSMYPRNCSEAAKHFPAEAKINRIQIYPLKDIGDFTPYNVICPWDEWIVIQRRFSSANMDRDWESYAAGFGDKESDFWLGLRTVHILTSRDNYKLRIDITKTSGIKKYVEYSTFRVGDEESGFRLEISGFSGNDNDQLKHHNGDRFSARDRDLDTYSGNCAVNYGGAFWYHGCYSVNLNGGGSNFNWNGALSYSEMKVHLA